MITKKLLSKYLLLFLCSLVVFVGINSLSNFAFFNIMDVLYQPHGPKGLLKVSIYVASYLFVFANLIFILFMKNGAIFKILIFALFILLNVDIVYYLIDKNGTGISMHQIVLAYHETSHILGAFWAYSGAIIISLLISVAILFAIKVIRKFIDIKFFYIPIMMLPLSLVGSYMVFNKSAYSAYEYPFFAKIPIYVYAAKHNGYFDIKFKARDALTIRPDGAAKYKNIILIVDESVRGDYLSINGFNMQTTPFLDTYDNVVSLGIASSGGNNSAPSQYIIRNGVQMRDLPDNKFATLAIPNIFQYAKNANFHTYYLDSQVEYQQLQNFMSSYDLEYIDEYFTIKERKPFYYLDRKLIPKIKTILSSKDHNFIYIVKYGSHVPWKMNYPENSATFSPVLENMESVEFSNRDRAINTYVNSLRWSMDGFFKELLSNISLDETIIIYTSDHGINIAESGTTMHYGMELNPPKTTATVPILLFAKDITSKYKFDKNIYSHFMIFPSVLDLMGYDKDIYHKYNYSFFSDSVSGEQARSFYSGNVFGNGYKNVFDSKGSQ